MKKLPSFDELQKPLPAWSPKKLVFAFVRFLLKTVGNLSDGIKIGNTFGYDSGVMLDYVYKNQAAGKWLVGRLLDRLYLDAVGWRGIRLRKILIKEALEKIVGAQLQKKAPIRYRPGAPERREARLEKHPLQTGRCVQCKKIIKKNGTSLSRQDSGKSLMMTIW